MEKKLNKLSILGEKIIILLSGFLLVVLCIFCFCGKAFMVMNKDEVTVWEKNGVLFMVVLPLCIVILLFSIRILVKIDSK